MAVPQLTRWQTRSIRNARRLAVIVYAPSLVLAAWQGYGLLMALGAIDIVRSDAVGFAPAGLAAFIASTAVIVWLADDFGFSELGSGFWVLEFPSQASALIRPIQMGAISGAHVLIGGLSLVVGMALVVIANLLLSCNGRATGVAKTSILLWPPYLASVVAGYAFLLLPTEMPDWPLVTPSFFEIGGRRLHSGLSLRLCPQYSSLTARWVTPLADALFFWRWPRFRSCFAWAPRSCRRTGVSLLVRLEANCSS